MQLPEPLHTPAGVREVAGVQHLFVHLHDAEAGGSHKN